MIEFKQGNLLEEKTEALVNTVNCVGVMGKGVALQFKQAFPENFKQYKKACDAHTVQPGKMFIVSTESLLFPRYIINFPTKQHWKGKSKLQDVKSGLAALVEDIRRYNIHSIAIPPLGCGNGGLDWNIVKPLITEAFADLPDVQVVIFEPSGAPAASEIKVATTTPNMTRARALLIQLIDRYQSGGYRLSKIEVQKLAYFLWASGISEFQKLQYGKDQFGPYAENLNHVLARIDGHYIRGFGDRNQNSEIRVLPEGRVASADFLNQDADAPQQLERISLLIDGFETPYGMEMLATLHWVAQEDPQAAIDPEYGIARVHEWNDRKRQLFKPDHLKVAWQRLQEQGWLRDHKDNAQQ
jgi:O-acetyl-ADP-ribose deacetylase (regulator of RNase III)